MSLEARERDRYVTGVLTSCAKMDLDKLRLAHFLCLVLILTKTELDKLMEIIKR